jgi:hypothetical protein
VKLTSVAAPPLLHSSPSISSGWVLAFYMVDRLRGLKVVFWCLGVWIQGWSIFECMSDV